MSQQLPCPAELDPAEAAAIRHGVIFAMCDAYSPAELAVMPGPLACRLELPDEGPGVVVVLDSEGSEVLRVPGDSLPPAEEFDVGPTFPR